MKNITPSIPVINLIIKKQAATKNTDKHETHTVILSKTHATVYKRLIEHAKLSKDDFKRILIDKRSPQPKSLLPVKLFSTRLLLM